MSKVTWVVCGTLALAGTAHAQKNESADQTTVTHELVIFADRTIAATKTDTPLVEIPQSISIITAEQIADRGALNYQEVFRYSGVDTERQGLEVRGDFMSARGFALKQYVDGLNKTPDFVYGSRLEVFLLERAEVLRGPSAVMYGAGSSGGLLNAVTKRPQFEFGGSFGMQIGNFERRQLQADVTGPLSDNVAARLVGVVREGELLSPGQPNDKWVAMPSLTWRAGENTEVTLIGMYAKEDLGTHTYLPADKSLFADADDPPVPHDLFVGEPDFNHMKADEYWTTVLVSHRFRDNVILTSNNRYMDQKVDYAEVYGFPPWADAERTLFPREFYILDADYNILNSDTNLQIDFQTGFVAHKVLVGMDYTKFKHARQEGFSCRGSTTGTCWPGGSPPPLDVYNPVYGQPFTYGFTNGYRTESMQLGFYLQDQMKFHDRVSLVLGVRRDRTTNQRTDAAKLENKATTVKAGLIGEIAKGISPYVSYSESFTPLFGTDFYGNHYKPQEAKQWEGGVKWQLSPTSLISAAYFDIEETGFLARDPDNIQNFLQGGAIGVKGVEFEAILNFPNGFGLTANYTDLTAEILRGTSSQPAGSRVPNLPDRLASIWLSKAFTVNDDLTWRVAAGVRRNGEEVDSTQTVVTPAVTLADAMAEVRYRDWTFSLNVNNVTDKEFYSQCTTSTCAPGVTRVIVGSVTRKF